MKIYKYNDKEIILELIKLINSNLRIHEDYRKDINNRFKEYDK